ncbi:hypothetical protein [Paracoccus sp. (in: a-proteobacteria)]|uniref:hypothetical protein n=1 Tax=Paracoccus sp. TaxID=267 RepID=UPI0026DF0D3C|nr:hypothetical protein [Paracoccus sp. (in: a-proteobacteria)]MDO5646829.1 hypothetical protein [Paracoccus sp. (in: a-proteobacteria)]
MTDIFASERRLSAALDRIDQLLEQAPQPHPTTGADPQVVEQLTRQLDMAEAENNRMAAMLADMQATDDGDLRARLAEAVELAAQLSSANEDLMTANRDLTDAQGSASDDDVRAAMQAEINALRAARAAEMSRMGDIMVELERLLGDQRAPVAEHSHNEQGGA